VVDRYRFLETVLVGRVLAVGAHPAADRLTVCQVDTGRGTLPVVCGAPNVAPGMLAPVALPGTALPSGIVIEAGSIRGQRSEGCFAAPLSWLWAPMPPASWG